MLHRAPPELERRFRRFLNGRGDELAPLFSCLRGGSSGARADSEAWAALILSRIYLLKGSTALAASFLDLSVHLFRRIAVIGVPLELNIERAAVLELRGEFRVAESLLRHTHDRAIRYGDSFAAEAAAGRIALLLSKAGRWNEAGSFLRFAQKSCSALRHEEALIGLEFARALIAFGNGCGGEAIDIVSLCVRRCREQELEYEAVAATLLLFELFLRTGDEEGAARCSRMMPRRGSLLRRFRALRIRFLSLMVDLHRLRGEGVKADRLRGRIIRMCRTLEIAECTLRWLPRADGASPAPCAARAPEIESCGAAARDGGAAPSGPRASAAPGAASPGGGLAEAVPPYSTRRGGRGGGDHVCTIITRNPRMLRLLGEARRAAAFPLPVLVTGESGTGKELIAELIHAAVGRSGHPFVPVNIAALPPELFESILFGHARGAFTGAVSRRRGLVEAAGEGTLFLDEIGEIARPLQAKLLRLLDRGEYMSIGDCTMKRNRARIVASTNCDLAAAVESGEFRADLYHRLRVLAFHLPPLRERRGDVPILVEHFARMCCEEYSLGPIRFSEAAVKLLAEYSWPGNVRELRHEIIRAVVRKWRGTVRVSDLSPRIIGSLGEPACVSAGSLPARLAALERDEIMAAMEDAGANRTQAAAALGVKRTTLIYRMKRLGIV